MSLFSSYSSVTVIATFSMDRDFYDVFKSIVIKNHQNVKGNPIRYMQYVIEHETPNVETIDNATSPSIGS